MFGGQTDLYRVQTDTFLATRLPCFQFSAVNIVFVSTTFAGV